MMITEVCDDKVTHRDYREDRVRSIHNRLAEGTYDIDEHLDAAVDRLIDDLIGENRPESAVKGTRRKPLNKVACVHR